VGIHRAARDTLYLQMLSLTSPTSCGRSVGVVADEVGSRVRDAQIYMKKQFGVTNVSEPVRQPLLWLTRP
jgi:hypothetical protein